ncbi:hypothetical protein ACHAWF_011211 [Thalassiosira exigua]
MLRASPPLLKMASTHGGMRRILKRRLPVQRYIELAVKAGSYKTPSTRPHYLGLHDVQPEPRGRLTPREREERLKLKRGIIDYPTEPPALFIRWSVAVKASEDGGVGGRSRKELTMSAVG